MADKNLQELLFALCRAKGVSGREDSAVSVAAELLGEYMPVKIDSLGSVIGTMGEGDVHIMLDAHIDEIGLVVTAIENGFLKVARCGGSDARVLAAAEVTVWGKQPLFGVITSTPPHLAGDGDIKKAKKIDEIAVDIGFSQEKAVELVSLGDRITFNGPQRSLINGIASPTVDDRAGVAVILRCLEIIKDTPLNVKLSVLFSVQEETGGSGAIAASYGINADEAIAVDVSFASAPSVKKEKSGTMGKGVMIGIAPSLDFAMSGKLKDLAQSKGIAYQLEVMGGRTGTNGDDIQVSAGGCKTALLSVPIRNMHTAVETVRLEDIEAAAQLMAAYIIERSGENA